MINLNEVTNRIKAAGRKNVRLIVMDGQDIATGDYKIEVFDGQWITIAEGVKKNIAESMITQALNKIILG